MNRVDDHAVQPGFIRSHPLGLVFPKFLFPAKDKVEANLPEQPHRLSGFLQPAPEVLEFRRTDLVFKLPEGQNIARARQRPVLLHDERKAGRGWNIHAVGFRMNPGFNPRR